MDIIMHKIVEIDELKFMALKEFIHLNIFFDSSTIKQNYQCTWQNQLLYFIFQNVLSICQNVDQEKQKQRI